MGRVVPIAISSFRNRPKRRLSICPFQFDEVIATCPKIGVDPGISTGASGMSDPIMAWAIQRTNSASPTAIIRWAPRDLASLISFTSPESPTIVSRQAMPLFSLSTSSMRFAQVSGGPPWADITATRGGFLPDELDSDDLEPLTRRLRLRDWEDRSSSLLKLLCSFITGYNTVKTVWFQLI